MFPVYDKVLAGLLALATVENERIMLKGSCIELRWAARERFGLHMCWRESIVVWLPAFRVLSCVLCALLWVNLRCLCSARCLISRCRL